jgi:hypothetical protein
MSLEKLYHNMLTSTEGSVLGVEMQERIYRHCVARKENELLVTLAKYPNLDPGIDNRIREHDDLNVIVAWATRPNRSSKELAERLLSDKRVAVLKPLAALPGLPAEVYATIAKINSANLAEILAGNTSVPLPIRIAKIKEHVKRMPRGAYNRHDERLHALCKDPVGPNGEIGAANHAQPMYEAVAETTLVPPYVVACLSKQYIREKDLDRWIEQFEALSANAGSDWGNQLAQIVTLISAHTTDDARRGRLVDKVKAYLARAGQSYRTARVQEALNKLVSLDPELETMFRELVESTDRENASELVKVIRVRAKSQDDLTRLAGIVARHAHVYAYLGIELLPSMSRGQDDKVFFVRLEAAKDYDSLLEIVMLNNQYGYMPNIFYAIENRKALMEYLIEDHRQKGKLLPDWASTIEPVSDDAEIALEMLTWKRVSENMSSIKGLVTLVESRILGALGNDPAKWEAFNGLADGFDGNLEDLLGAAKTLSA